MSTKERVYLMKIWKKVIQMLSDFGMIEEAILFCFGASDLKAAKDLIELGIQFK